jgi:DNA-binding response OmpR family regulator
MVVDFENLNVLVVADAPPLKILLMPVLRTIGVNNILATGNATEGFDLFFRHSPDLVLADWYMALSKGVELTQKIRRVSSFPRHRTPVILMTGEETAPSDMIQAQDAGASGHRHGA